MNKEKQAGFAVPHSNWVGVGIGSGLGLGWVWVGSGLGSRLGLGCIWIRIGSDLKKIKHWGLGGWFVWSILKPLCGPNPLGFFPQGRVWQ